MQERLFLPSCLSTNDRQLINAIDLGIEEKKLREGAAFDALRATQMAVKALVVLQKDKQKQSRGQVQNLRSRRFIVRAEAWRDLCMEEYNDHRTALSRLDLDNNDTDSQFPVLEIKDTYMKSTRFTRQLGDSRKVDGGLWSFTKHGRLGSQSRAPVANDSNDVGTQMSRRKKRKKFLTFSPE